MVGGMGWDTWGGGSKGFLEGEGRTWWVGVKAYFYWDADDKI